MNETQQKEVHSVKSSELEATTKHSQEQLEAKNNKISHLEKQVEELEQKLQLANSKLTEKVCFSDHAKFPFQLVKRN